MLVGPFVIILRIPPFLGVKPLFGIVAQTSSVGGAVVVIVGDADVVVVGGLAVVVVEVMGAVVVVLGGVVVAWLQLIMTNVKTMMIARITKSFFNLFLLKH